MRQINPGQKLPVRGRSPAAPSPTADPQPCIGAETAQEAGTWPHQPAPQGHPVRATCAG